MKIRKESQGTNKWSIDVCSRLRLLIVIPVVGESVSIIGPSDDGSDKKVRIR